MSLSSFIPGFILATLPATYDLWTCATCDTYWSGTDSCWCCDEVGEKVVEVVLSGKGEPIRRPLKQIHHFGCPPPGFVVPGQSVAQGGVYRVPGGEGSGTTRDGHEGFQRVRTIVDVPDVGSGCDEDRSEDVDATG